MCLFSGELKVILEFYDMWSHNIKQCSFIIIQIQSYGISLTNHKTYKFHYQNLVGFTINKNMKCSKVMDFVCFCLL